MANEKWLIDANVVLAKQFTAGLSDANGNYYGHADVVFVHDIENAPTVDAVSKGLFDQIKWERDIAIEQLADYGISLGEKADVAKVVHGRWEKAHLAGYLKCNCCKDAFIYEEWLKSGKWNYCPNCGANMMDGDVNA